MVTEVKDVSQYWKTVLDTVPDALLIMSPSGEILSVNRAAEEITGYGSQELLGSPCTILHCTGCRLFGKGPGKDWCSLYAEGKVVTKKCLIKNKKNEQIPVLKRATVLYDDSGRIMGAVEALSDITEMVNKEAEIVSLRRSLTEEEGFYGILGHSPQMQRLFDLIENTARSDAPVLIHGESGTGKELVARAVHELSIRNSQPFIKVNCAALNQNLLETELFGHVKGAFTGAERSRTGRFEAAHGGDIFLDEIGDVPLPTQVKLLRVLEEKEIEKVGDHQPIKVNVRFITATHRDLNQLISEGIFREDLFYRINVVPLTVPPLRQRREDIPFLAQTFLERLALKTSKPIGGISAPAMALLYNHAWPGNVRELKNAIEYAFVLCHEGLIQPQHLPDRISPSTASSRDIQPLPAPRPKVPEDKRQLLLDALRQTGGNQTRAAQILGVSRMTVWKQMKKYGLNIRRDIG